jgi:hypothetical protein
MEDLFSRYQLSFESLAKYIRGTWDPEKSPSLEAIRDSLSDGQIASKLWVIDELSNVESLVRWAKLYPKSYGVFGGWTGLQCRFIIDYLSPGAVTNIELVQSLEHINYCTMAGFDKFRFIHADMFDFDYEANNFDVYVNTSTEHIPSVSDWVKRIPGSKIVCVQSNNFFECNQHVNCVNSADEFLEDLLKAGNVRNILYTGTMKLPIYDRYMIIAAT